MNSESKGVPATPPTLQVKNFLAEPCPWQDYEKTWHSMRDFTARRRPGTEDQLWVLEHAAVFTLGQAGEPKHILNAADIPVVHTDRGGQVTYHGPGQLVFYLMADLRALDLGVRKLVETLEQAVINVLAGYAIAAEGNRDAPGVYVQGAKIAALGLRVSRGCSYHGLSFNYDMDLSPFSRINLCGHERLPVTQFASLYSVGGRPGPLPSKRDIADRVVCEICRLLGYASLSTSIACGDKHSPGTAS